jgi:ligand-binding SRPBCC domain-containing protein
MKRNYTVKVTRISTIVLTAYDEEDACEIASQTPFQSPDWEHTTEFEAEENYDHEEES